MVSVAFCIYAAIFLFSSNDGYLVSSDIGFLHLSDNSTAAILDRNTIVKIGENSSLLAIFQRVLAAPQESPIYIDISSDGTGPVPDIIAWKVIQRKEDNVSIRFGETTECERALLFDNDRFICNEEMYIELFDVIELAVAQSSKP